MNPGGLIGNGLDRTVRTLAAAERVAARLPAAVHVMRGRPIISGVHIRPPLHLIDPHRLLVNGVTITGDAAHPGPGIVIGDR